MQPVLSFSPAAYIHWFAQSYCAATDATTTMLRLLLLYQFWLGEICICHKTRPTRDKMHDLQIALPRTLMLPFFSILPVLHTQDTFALVLNFELGHFTCHFLLLSFFLLVLLWKELNPHNFVVTFHFSHSFGSPPVFYPAGDGCWIDINVDCYACLYSMPLIVSLNNEPQLAHQKQQSVGSAFQFYKTLTGTTTLGQSRPESNGIGEWLHTPQITRTGTLPSDAIWCHTQNSHFFFLHKGCRLHILSLTDKDSQYKWEHAYITRVSEKSKSFCHLITRSILIPAISDFNSMCRINSEFYLDKTDCIPHNTNTLGKGMNPIILPPAMGK